MLLALRIRNFKSLRQAHIRFGPLTGLIGHNGAGKSNLFDAIHFMSCLADRDIHSAASEVRSTKEGSYSPLDLVFGRNRDNDIELSADMIVPRLVVDDFGEEARPTTTLLTYTVALRYIPDSDRLVVLREHLVHSKLGNYRDYTKFPSSKQFRASVAVGTRRGGPLISTKDNRTFLHGDGGSRGRPYPVGKSPLTVVGGTNTHDYPTVLAAKREMASWRFLHLEPTAMRTPDSRSAEPHVSSSGGHIAATLHSLAINNSDVRSEIVNRLRQLNSDVKELEAFQDKARDQYALRARLPGVDNWLYGRSLSEGTLRYIALVLMLVDVQDRAVLCLEEPENGIHPSKVPSLVRLLRDYAVDLDEPVADDNPLRQVIINTHSTEVARQLRFEEIIFVERAVTKSYGVVSVFRPIESTWRVGNDEYPSAIPKDRQSVVDFIGGAPLGPDLDQYEFDFGTAT